MGKDTAPPSGFMTRSDREIEIDLGNGQFVRLVRVGDSIRWEVRDATAPPAIARLGTIAERNNRRRGLPRVRPM